MSDELKACQIQYSFSPTFCPEHRSEGDKIIIIEDWFFTKAVVLWQNCEDRSRSCVQYIRKPNKLLAPVLQKQHGDKQNLMRFPYRGRRNETTARTFIVF